MVNIETLPCGIRVIYEQIPHFRSVAVGVWVGTGSVDELDGEHGLSHVLEHMVFKGTRGYTAQQIAYAMDSVGGNLNAFTSKEVTCYYAKVADEHLPVAIDVLCELAMQPILDAEDLEKEKKVILEEISMIEDSPEDLVMDLLGEAFFRGHPLANPISSTADIVGAYEAGDVRAYYRRRYLPANMVISVAGNFEPAQLMDEIKRRFQGFVPGQPAAREWMPAPCDGGRRSALRDREFEQTHICLGLRGCPGATPEVYPTMVLNNILGGSMSSRLFQKVREAEGLVYSVYSFPSFFKQTGVFGIYAACKHSNVARAVQIIAQEIKAVRDGCITQEEFCRAKEQLKGNYALSQDSVSSHMNALGKNLLLHNRVMGEEETLARISAVTLDDVKAQAACTLDTAYMAAAGVGRIPQPEQMKEILLDW